tara:strand:- start:219 stop:416 length:198 start_codon:yes stop_codon:yes gene_type:complete
VLEQASSSGYGFVFSALVAQKWEVADDEGLLMQGGSKTSAHCLGVVEHLLDGHWQGGGMAEGHHR